MCSDLASDSSDRYETSWTVSDAISEAETMISFIHITDIILTDQRFHEMLSVFLPISFLLCAICYSR